MTGAPALIAASHGTSHPDGQRAVAALVAAAAAAAGRAATEPVTVRESFVDVQEPYVRQSLGELDPGVDAVVVPLLLSAGYHVRVDLARDARETRDRHVTIAGALGPDPRIAQLLARRLSEAGLAPDDMVVLGAAGSSDQNAVEDCRVAGAQLAELLGRPVAVGFVSAATPRLAVAVSSARRLAAGGRVVLATYLLAPGYFAELASTAGADLVTAPLLRADEPVPDELVDVILDRFYAACNADVSALSHAASDAVTTW